MNFRLSQPLGIVLVAVTLGLSPRAEALPKIFGFGKKDPSVPPGASQLADQEARAAARLNEISATEAAGKTAAAAKAYDKLAAEYPFTKAAATAQFRAAQLLEREGKQGKAFDAYQRLIEKHPQSTEYATALERQFELANALRNDPGGVLGFGKRTTEDLVEMYQKVIANGTRSPYAPKAQFAIAELYAQRNGLGDDALSTAAYQKIKDTYPDSPEAVEAAMRIGNVNLAVAERSRDASNLSQARDAFEDAQTLFGGNPQVAESQGVLLQISESEAEKAYKTGQFYEKKGQLKAAAIYYSEALKAPTASVFADARERLGELSQRDPKLVDSMAGLNLADANLAVPAKVDTKSRADYFGPPPPPERVRKPQMRVDDTIPFAPIEEPMLPSRDDTIPMTEDLLLPPPPVPATPGDAAPEAPEPPPAAPQDDAPSDAAPVLPPPADPAEPAPTEPAPAPAGP